MAILYPDWNSINTLSQPPTEGESHLLKFLSNNLDNTYEIFFQPYINGDRPDIVLMRKESGVLIIEVKDWNLKNYYVEKGKWFFKGKHQILSPYQQVNEYKTQLYNLHVPDLLEYKIKNPNLFAIVNNLVYFHNDESKRIEDIKNSETEQHKKFIHTLAKPELNKYRINDIFTQTYMNRQSRLFNDVLYHKFKRILKPPFHTLEEGKEIKYSKEQLKLITSKSEMKKIKGVAGSGKTIVLSKRAVNAHKRTKSNVLILCYNITMRNYLRDNISKVRESFEWEKFHIMNYHNLISAHLRNISIAPLSVFKSYLENNYSKVYYEIKSELKSNDRDEFFKELSKKLDADTISDIWDKAIYSNKGLMESLNLDTNDKYQAIFIDEVQDYKYEWLEILKNTFLIAGGEFVVFGDEKQNIYERELEEKKIRTNIPGRWDESLKKSFRLNEKIAFIASNFQKEFLINYNNDEIESWQTEIFYNIDVEYYNVKELKISSIAQFIDKYIKKKSISSNDICILGSRTSILRELDYNLRKIILEKTTTTFETEEIIEKLISDQISKGNNTKNTTMEHGALQEALLKVKDKLDIDNNIKHQIKDKEQQKIINMFVNEINNIRKNKKFNFQMNTGLLKLSTVHSFKGWEIPTLFLYLDEYDDKKENYELIYTAVTRCRFHLIVLSHGSKRYEEFFKKHADIIENISKGEK